MPMPKKPISYRYKTGVVTDPNDVAHQKGIEDEFGDAGRPGTSRRLGDYYRGGGAGTAQVPDGPGTATIAASGEQKFSNYRLTDSTQAPPHLPPGVPKGTKIFEFQPVYRTAVGLLPEPRDAANRILYSWSMPGVVIPPVIMRRGNITSAATQAWETKWHEGSNAATIMNLAEEKGKHHGSNVMTVHETMLAPLVGLEIVGITLGGRSSASSSATTGDIQELVIQFKAPPGFAYRSFWPTTDPHYNHNLIQHAVFTSDAQPGVKLTLTDQVMLSQQRVKDFQSHSFTDHTYYGLNTGSRINHALINGKAIETFYLTWKKPRYLPKTGPALQKWRDLVTMAQATIAADKYMKVFLWITDGGLYVPPPPFPWTSPPSLSPETPGGLGAGTLPAGTVNLRFTRKGTTAPWVIQATSATGAGVGGVAVAIVAAWTAGPNPWGGPGGTGTGVPNFGSVGLTGTTNAAGHWTGGAMPTAKPGGVALWVGCTYFNTQTGVSVIGTPDFFQAI